ncbi:glycoside hydrolase family 3 C-terminal domain-containing protein [Pelomonas sp. P7]|uniref:Glycoside hydrolase family 3 C-terminal domain-containing protein n=1 Tax=Pelomonas caseinilytica TaxID=2906763 RepID=A0ABS8XFS2_9BURK|nr:glycoside hydrolase family 3 C-terminal domain-containing protein [Pelomonas sp. P7]MCE4539739.1 glycoside hydrolase family 3 C-terminal domain-containing protein [Pelomonas sp. P7]
MKSSQLRTPALALALAWATCVAAAPLTPSMQQAQALVAQMTLAEKASQLQHESPAIPRLGIPAYNWWSEGLHGVARADIATVFPQAIGLAATWDTPLVKRVGEVVGTEFRAKFLATVGADGSSTLYRGLTVWSPNVNIFRDPRWGRGQETYGEDPYLTSRMGVAYIQGLQGPDANQPRVSAAVKHFAVHSGPEADRHREDVKVAPRDLVDTYLPAFHAAVTEGRAESVMCAYNAVDGVPACANEPLLKHTLRDEWKFQGHVVSDCGAVADIHMDGAHHYVKTPEAAVAAAVHAGTDLICDFGSNKTAQGATTVAAVQQGLLSEAELDRALHRLFDVRLRLGLLAAPAQRPFPQITARDFDTPAHRALNLETARRSLVLLKNDGLLPLKAAPRRIAVIGPNADSVDALVGNYNGTPSRPVTLLAGLKARFPEARIDVVEGTGWVAPPLEDLPAANLCADAACSRPGLQFERFANLKLEGEPSTSAVTPQAVFRWGWPDAHDRQESARWTGFLRASESGEHLLRLRGNRGYRIWIDGELVVDLWDIAWPTSTRGVKLKAGQTYALRVEALQTGWDGEQRLQWSRPGASDEAALAAAREADVVVFASGLTWELEGEEMTVLAPGFAGGDRTRIDLPAPQLRLLERLAALGQPLVLVNFSGSPMAFGAATQQAAAIVQAWYPGGEGGQAVAELLAGDFSPSARLPLTFYRSVEQLPPFKDYGMQGRTYRWFKGDAEFPFGHGLGYARFDYADAKLARSRLRAGEGVKLSVRLKNDSSREAAEVVQVYARRSSAQAPERSLVAFRRVVLRPGESRRLDFELSAEALSTVRADGRRVVEAGPAWLWVGGGQPVAAVTGTKAPGRMLKLEVAGRTDLPAFAPAAKNQEAGE